MILLMRLLYHLPFSPHTPLHPKSACRLLRPSVAVLEKSTIPLEPPPRISRVDPSLLLPILLRLSSLDAVHVRLARVPSIAILAGRRASNHSRGNPSLDIARSSNALFPASRVKVTPTPRPRANHLRRGEIRGEIRSILEHQVSLLASRVARPGASPPGNVLALFTRDSGGVVGSYARDTRADAFSTEASRASRPYATGAVRARRGSSGRR